MRFATLPAMMCALSVVAAPVYTQGRGNSQPKKTAVTSTPRVKSTSQTVKTNVKVDTRASKTTAKATSKTAKAATKTAKATTRVAKAETKAARKTGAATSSTPVPVTPPVTTVVTPTTPTTTSVKNPKLEARLRAMLPAGTTIQDASQGFKNWGQFVAAVHVSNNLNIPFADLKAKMTGITAVVPGAPLPTVPPTTTTTMSLGQAIQSLKGTTTTEPATLTSSKIRTEVKKAEDATSVDLQRTRDRS